MERETADEHAAEGVNLQELVDDLDAVIWEADPLTFDFLFVNRRAVDLLGYSRSEWYRPGFWAGQLIYPPDRATTVAVCRNAVLERTDHQIEYRAQTADGRIVWMRDFIRVVVGDDGGLRALRGVMVDVTAEKEIRAELDDERAEMLSIAHEREATLEALRASESHYRRLVRTSPFAVFVTDAQGVVTEVNEAAAELIGRTAEEILGRHFAGFVAPESLDLAQGRFAEILGGPGRPLELELAVRRPDGERRMIHATATAIVHDGVVTGIHGVARDITLERVADRNRRLLAAALDNLPDAVSVTTRDLRYVYTNRAHAQLFRYDREAGPESAAALIPDDESHVQMREIYAALEQERRWVGRMRRKRADGSVLVTSATIFAVRDGKEDYALTVMRDASVEISRDQHLRRVERLASLGTLIAGVAHELNNPLTAVVGFAHLMLLDERPPEDQETLATMAREAERAARIVADLRLVARNTQEDGPAARAAVDLNDVVRHVLKVRRYSLDTRNIRVDADLADDLPPVAANRAQLEQVVVNVVVNAEQALDRHAGGSRVLTVRTRRSALGVALHVADNGPGIRSEHLDRVFDPFFTTKAPGEGTGLGLSLVHTIVTDHGGSMRVESGVDRGAEFVIELPAADADTAVDDDETVPPPARAERPLRVLVVDDESAIRELLVRALTRRGHSVIEAREGGEALRVIDELKADIDVIVSDVRMPGLSGADLLDRLRGAHPKLARRVVFITGDAVPFEAASVPPEEVPVLLKPFQLDVAAALVEARAADQDSSSSSG